MKLQTLESFPLLRLAADLHQAGRDPHRWPQAWQAMCEFFACTEVFASRLPEGLVPVQMLALVSERAIRARECVEQQRGTCVCTDDLPRYLVCRELLPHLEMALDATRPPVSAEAPQWSALDALPFPIFVCNRDRQLLLVNAVAQRELDQAIWLRQVNGRLVGANSPIEGRLAKALVGETSDDRHLGLLLPGLPDADLIFRQVLSRQGEQHWVLRLLHYRRQTDLGLPRLASALGLTARQTELAQLLIAGQTLTEAAQSMGIVRGSANDLLKRLFEATETRRQAELVGYLNRRLASR